MAFSWKAVVPEIPVANLQRALDYYQGTLGFNVDWVYEGRFASLSEGGARLFLALASGHPRVHLDLYVDDVDAVYQELKERGAVVVSEPEDMPWGTREFGAEDPDGNFLRIHTLLADRTP